MFVEHALPRCIVRSAYAVIRGNQRRRSEIEWKGQPPLCRLSQNSSLDSISFRGHELEIHLHTRRIQWRVRSCGPGSKNRLKRFRYSFSQYSGIQHNGIMTLLESEQLCVPCQASPRTRSHTLIIFLYSFASTFDTCLYCFQAVSLFPRVTLAVLYRCMLHKPIMCHVLLHA